MRTNDIFIETFNKEQQLLLKQKFLDEREKNIQQRENDLKNHPVQENIDRLNDLKALYLYLANEKAFSMEKVGGAYINEDGNISLKNMLSGLKRYKEEQKNNKKL